MWTFCWRAVDAVRWVLSAFGLAVTFGVEPSTAALDERLEPGADAIGLDARGLDAWLLAHRVMWPALAAGVPMVVGGEFAAGLQGVPIADPEMVLSVRSRRRSRSACRLSRWLCCRSPGSSDRLRRRWPPGCCSGR